MKKKIFSLLLAFAIVFGVFIPVNIFPETEIVADAGIALTVNDWDTLKNQLALTGPAELKLGKDLTLKKDLGSYQEGVFLKVRGDKVLDLNGFSITVLDYSNVESNKDVSHICESTVFNVNGGNLTINDSKGGGVISNDGYYISPAVLLFDNAIYYGRTERHLFYVRNGSLTINGGTYIAGGAKEQYLSDEVCYAHLVNPGYIVTSDENAVITINDGNFTAHGLKQGKYTYGGILYNISSSAKADIYGGNFHVKGEAGIISWSGELNIYNGTFKMSRFSKIRRPCSYDLDANNVSDCESAKMNIHDSYWNSDYTKVYLDNKLQESLAKDQFKNYTGTGKVRFSSVVLKGETKLSSATTYVGDKVSVEFTDEVLKLYNRSSASFTYNWQVKKSFEWEDIEGANSKDYVTTKDVVGYKIRCRIQIKGYPNAFSTNYGDVIKRLNNEVPKRPSVGVDYANGRFQILDLIYHPDQEFVFCKDNSATWPSNADAINIDKNGKTYVTLEKNKTYYLYTRFKETETHAAGEKVYVFPVALAETINLTSLFVYPECESVGYNKLVKITVEPNPTNATNFYGGVTGNNWSLNNGTGSGAKLYADSQGTKELEAYTPYTEVYLKGGDNAEVVKVSVEKTVGPGAPVRGEAYVNTQGKNGTYAFKNDEIRYKYNGKLIGTDAEPLVIEQGSSVIIQLDNYKYPTKPINAVSVVHDSGQNIAGLGFDYRSGNNYMTITASDTSPVASGKYLIKVNGTEQYNRLAVKVVEKNIPLEKVTLDKTSFITGVGETTQLTASVLPYNATIGAISWESSDTSVATVSDSGAVTAKKVGTAKITATAGGETATCSVVVSEKVKKYKVDVEYGTANAEYASKGTTVKVTADAAKPGFVFDKWMSSSVSFANASSATTSFTMPAGAVAVTATYKAVEYTVSVTNGTASAKKATIGTKVTITAGSNFCKWSVTGATVQNAKSSSTSFTMGSENVVAVAKGHSLTKVAAVKATCTKNGNIEHYKCTACGKLFKDSAGKTVITDVTVKAAHKLQKVAAVKATCTKNGNIEHYKCTACGKLFKDSAGKTAITDVTVKAPGHSVTKVKAVKATCTKNGNIEHYKCTACGKLFKDSAGKTAITDVTVKAAHTLKKVAAVKATCTKNGNIEHYKCTACGKLFKDAAGKTLIPDATAKASGHQYEWVIAKNAQVGVKGEKVYQCKVCKLIKEKQEIPELKPLYMLGDIDDDKAITSSDARLALRASVGLETFNEIQTLAADVDKDLIITSSDARVLLRVSVGLETLN